ncbi:MAG: hypothetical protein methR_P2024 [Methyloprofundus sp.]|nr:MAG: hypothetical protein methR_P2024 [Methyloprofundus sp.]
MRLSSIPLAIAMIALHSTSHAAPPLPAGLEPQPSTPALPPGLGSSNSPNLPTGLTPPPSAPALPSGLNTPPLPGGLAPSTSPGLPTGLNTSPALPSSLNQAGNIAEEEESEYFGLFDKDEPFINISGFWDIRGGVRTQDDPYSDQLSLGETRLQLALQKDVGPFSMNLVTDFLYDAQVDAHHINLNTGKGFIDLREANIAFSPISFLDVKVGRQILTWGTGDLIFINDLFPKDWQAFFIGRDLEYLKAPSDSLKTSFFTDYANLDFVYTPWFDADRGITGEKLSYYNPMLGSLAGQNAVIEPETPSGGEFALRLYKNVGVNELALYGYHGFWKSPQGFNPATGKARYPKMRSLGASIRRPIWKGIANIEVGYYDSYEKSSSSDPFTPNSEARFLIGYEQEIVQNFSIGVQYYVEWMQDYKHYVTGQQQIGAEPLRDEVRHLLTNRLTLMTHQQNVTWSLFTFFSPSDMDAYFRPNIAYKVTDAWMVEAGGNFFVGHKESSFFGQFEKNNNVYGSVRYSF